MYTYKFTQTQTNIYIHKHIYYVCVFLFQFQFNVNRDAFQMYKFPHVSPPQSICNSLALRTYCMLHSTL